MVDKAKELTPADKYLEVELLFHDLGRQMTQAVASYYIWSTLHFSLSRAEVGEETAQNNLVAIKPYHYFFVHTEFAHLHSFILAITKFYDRTADSNTINNILNKLQQYAIDITPEVIKSTRPDKFDEEGLSSMANLFYDQTTLNKIDLIRSNNSALVSKLFNFRNKVIAHNEYGTDFDRSFIPTEVEALIADSQKIFNLLQHNAYLATTDWTGMKEESVRHTKQLLETLNLGETTRIANIRRKYNVSLDESENFSRNA